MACALAVPVWVAHDSSAWDVRVYGKAISSVEAGRDPYLDAMAIQKQHHALVLANGGMDRDAAPPWSYVYSPVTLPLLRAIAHIPVSVAIAGYWTVYITGVLAAILAVLCFATAAERKWLLYAAAVSPFFPGLLANGTILGGNVAYILYGAVLAAALRGWRTHRWLLFYAAVLLASCVKAPLLSLALIPALSAPRQWVPVLATMASGTALFAGQALVWPLLFRHYLEAVELQFSFNHDFGCSPAGLISQLLYHQGLPYSTASSLLYAAYAVPVLVMLIYMSRVHLHAELRLHWIPVLLLGIILLNPRIMEYDAAPVTIPMALIAWRVASAVTQSRVRLVVLAISFVLLNGVSLYSWEWRKAIDGPLLAGLFCGGCWLLLRSSKEGGKLPVRAAVFDTASV